MDDPGVIVVLSERDRVERWRFEQLVRAGFPEELALSLACDLTVDLHRSVGLVEHGCSLSLAERILL